MYIKYLYFILKDYRLYDQFIEYLENKKDTNQ